MPGVIILPSLGGRSLLSRAVAFALATAIVAALPLGQAAAGVSDDGVRDRLAAEARLELLAELAAVRADAVAEGYDDLVAEIDTLAAPRPASPLARRPGRVRVRPADADDRRHELERRLARARDGYAAGLFRLSRSAVSAGHPAEAFHRLEEAARVQPDYKPVRQQLGDQRVGEVWMTPFEAVMQRERKVWDDRFGWLPREHIARYAAGERMYQGQWRTVADIAAIRSASRRAWQVETDHFVVHSNHSLERAAALAGRLEDYHRFLKRRFTLLFDAPALRRTLLEEGPIPSRDKHTVRDFASQAEYVARLSPKMPGVEISNGIYLTRDRTAYFFANDNAEATARPEEVLYHEVLHQVLYEADRRDRAIAADAHFWPVEGLASYFETFTPEAVRPDDAGDLDPNAPLIGDIDHPRLYRARERLLQETQHTPLVEFSSLGMRAFQRGETLEEIQGRYAQATGLTHFFLHFGAAEPLGPGRYRDAFLQHVREIYDARIRRATPLWQLTGMPPEQLDRQYREYLRELDAAARFAVLAERRPE